MLVLGREVDEELVIVVPGYAPIRVMLVDIRSMNRVRLGVKANAEINVYRGEIWDRIQSQDQKPPTASVTDKREQD